MKTKKKIKLSYVDDWEGFKDCCSKAKGKETLLKFMI